MAGKVRYIKSLLLMVFTLWVFCARPQTPAQIIAALRGLNLEIASLPCNTGKGRRVDYTAMNLFLSNKVSYYLSDKGDLSLYKNYVTVDAARGVIAINHNLHQPADNEPVKSFTIVGARAFFADAYAARFSNAYTDNQLGINIEEVWMGKPTTHYNACGNQKQGMDANRALIVEELGREITAKAAAFENNLAALNATSLPGQDVQTARASLSQDFYAALKTEYLLKFAEAQCALLISTNNYNIITDNWTSVALYVPVIPQKFQVASGTAQTSRYNYPLELSATHTWLVDAPNIGRLFISLGAGASLNNSVQAGKLTASTQGVYTGAFENFLTPVVSGKFVYLPPSSHVGISARLEKNFGTYQALNGIIGIPIVLIDKKGVPAVNFECQLIWDDMGHSVKESLPGNGASIGLTVGIPFSKIVY